MYACLHSIDFFGGNRMKIKKWEMILAVLFVFVLVSSLHVSAQQRALSDKLIRLHVVANSDSDADQELKLEARDAVLDQLSDLLSGVSSRDEAAQLIEENLTSIEETARAVVRDAGCDYAVTACLTQEDSPTKEYETFALPAGVYTSLRVTIGSGAGHNWWCVLYPPLCTASALDSDSAAMLTDDEINLITGGGGEYVVRFKCMELLAQIKALFKS
jgi:stage II sporulation protein R